jgi:hypothetical protein
MEPSITTYTQQQLIDTAKWTLAECRCPDKGHRVRLVDFDLRIHPAIGSTVSLAVKGECKRCQYQITRYCAI